MLSSTASIALGRTGSGECLIDRLYAGYMKDAQKTDHISLNTLIGYLRQGLYVNFQRDFEWRP